MKYINDTKKRMLTDAVFLFLTGAFIGWVYEVVLQLFQSGMFVNRGMLHGPWLPIYGVGCLVMVGLKKVIGDRPIPYFLISSAACGVLEYTSSWLFEAIYHVRWWDYSDFRFNLNGRIFLGGLIGFGVAGCAFVFVLLPMMKKQYRRIPEKTRYWLAAVLLIAFLADLLLSLLCPNMGFGITNY